MLAQKGSAVETDDQFFAALRAGDDSTLGVILADDFVIVDVMSGVSTTGQPSSAA